METHLDVKMYGDSYKSCNVWRILWWVQCMESHIENSMNGISYRGYKLWSLV